jgi:YVTN family beta-propeller protein
MKIGIQKLTLWCTQKMSKQLKRLFSLCSNEDEDSVEAPSTKIARMAEYLTRKAGEFAKTAEKDLVKTTKELAKTAQELAKVTCIKAMEERAQEAENLAQTAEDPAKIAQFHARAVWYRAEVDRFHQQTIILILQAEQRRITAWGQIQEKKKKGMYPEIRTDSICTDVNFIVLQQVLMFLEARAKEAEDRQMLAYVTTNCDTISMIATTSNTVMNTIVIGSEVELVAITPNGTKAFVTNYSDPHNCVSIIDTASNIVMDTLEMEENINDLAITPNSMQVYMITRRENKEHYRFSPLILSVFDIVRYGVIATIDLTKYLSSQKCRHHVASIAIAPDGTRAYVVTDEGIVIVTDTATNQVIDTISIDNAASKIAITPDGEKLYVTTAKNYISVIDTTRYVVTTIQVRSNVKGVAITPDGKKVYVASFDYNNPEEWDTVYVIATADNTVITTIKVSWKPARIAFTPDGKRAYVTHLNPQCISVIDVASHEVVTTVWGVDDPREVAISRRPAW